MAQLAEVWEDIQIFMEIGGNVLLAIAAVTFLMWTLILERGWYFNFTYPRLVKKVQQSWMARRDRCSWYAKQIRQQQISEISMKLNRNLTAIRTFIAVCPLLGLLGTVTGMIEVFNVMAIVGSGNARALASGVYLATVPTMSGMVAALSGVYFSARLDKRAKAKMLEVEESIPMERGEPCAASV